MAEMRLEFAGFVLNAPLSSAICPLTVRCRLGDYTRAMMIKRILTIWARLERRWRRARRELRWPRPSRAIRSPPGGCMRRRRRHIRAAIRPTIAALRHAGFRRLEDDEDRRVGAAAAWSNAFAGRSALWPARPVPPTERGAPLGPVISPDDPRYGRPAAPAGDLCEPARRPQPAYCDRAQWRFWPATSSQGRRWPPAARATGSMRHRNLQPLGADGRPMALVRVAAGGTAGSRTGATAAELASAGSRLRDQGTGRNADRRYAEHLSLLHPGGRTRDPLRRSRRPRRLHLDRRAEDLAQGGMAGLASADRK